MSEESRVDRLVRIINKTNYRKESEISHPQRLLQKINGRFAVTEATPFGRKELDEAIEIVRNNPTMVENRRGTAMKLNIMCLHCGRWMVFHSEPVHGKKPAAILSTGTREEKRDKQDYSFIRKYSKLKGELASLVGLPIPAAYRDFQYQYKTKENGIKGNRLIELLRAHIRTLRTQIKEQEAINNGE